MPFTITFARDLAPGPEAVFAAWIDPRVRARFETPEGSGMRHESLDTREGGFEVTAIEEDGAKIGEAETFVALMVPPENGAAGLILTQGRVAFAGRTHLLTQATLAFVPHEGGTRLSGTVQAVSPTGAPGEPEIREGWDGMLDRFAAILEERP